GRQALHAWKLAFAHPRTGKPLAFEAPVPPDFQRALDLLRRHRA
ncbi:MAG: RluA family pseudouridine synthase, partial [Myxococcaceae bacterium]